MKGMFSEIERRGAELLGRFIEQARRRRGLTIEDVATLIRVDSAAVKKWESGEAKPDTAAALGLAWVLDVKPSEILSGNTICPFPPVPDWQLPILMMAALEGLKQELGAEKAIEVMGRAVLAYEAKTMGAKK